MIRLIFQGSKWNSSFFISSESSLISRYWNSASFFFPGHMWLANAPEENYFESQLVLTACSWGIYSVGAATCKNRTKRIQVAVVLTISFSGVKLKLRFPILWRNLVFWNVYFIPNENLMSTLSNRWYLQKKMKYLHHVFPFSAVTLRNDMMYSVPYYFGATFG